MSNFTIAPNTDLHRHSGQLVEGGLAGVVVQVGAGGDSLPERLPRPHKHSLNNTHAVLGE